MKFFVFCFFGGEKELHLYETGIVGQEFLKSENG